MGAWIETFKLLIINDINQSHPVWVRGLKHRPLWIGGGGPKVSHPVWVRGLKLIVKYLFENKTCVAPRVGAWIETPIYPVL